MIWVPTTNTDTIEDTGIGLTEDHMDINGDPHLVKTVIQVPLDDPNKGNIESMGVDPKNNGPSTTPGTGPVECHGDGVSALSDPEGPAAAVDDVIV